MQDTEVIYAQNWGLADYEAALKRQLSCHEQVLGGKALGYLNFVEHPPTVSFGKHGRAEHLLVSPKQLQEAGVACVRTDRGGEVTAHMPGQLVIYPILNLPRLGLGARKYVDRLLDVTILTLSELGVKAHTDSEHPGVWVGTAKICAVGIRIRSRVSMHGIALNVHNNLELFKQMIPCGIEARGVTSLHHLTGEKIELSKIGLIWQKNFAKLFGRVVTDIS